MTYHVLRAQSVEKTEREEKERREAWAQRKPKLDQRHADLMRERREADLEQEAIAVERRQRREEAKADLERMDAEALEMANSREEFDYIQRKADEIQHLRETAGEV